MNQPLHGMRCAFYFYGIGLGNLNVYLISQMTCSDQPMNKSVFCPSQASPTQFNESEEMKGMVNLSRT